MNNERSEESAVVNDIRTMREEGLAKHFEEARRRLQKVIHFRLDYRLRGRVSESDVLQETYVRAAKHIDRFLDNDIPFFVWLRLEASQRLQEIHRQHLEAEKRDVRKEIKLLRPNCGGQTSIALAAHLVAQMTSVSQLIEKAEQINALEVTLQEMNEMDREVIALRNFEELSNIETADVLGIDPAAASKRYVRALKRLKEIFESHQLGK